MSDPRDIAALELCRQLDEKDAEIARLRAALFNIVGDGGPLDDPCCFDHNGNCQAHFVDHPCSVRVAREVLQSDD